MIALWEEAGEDSGVCHRVITGTDVFLCTEKKHRRCEKAANGTI